ncbi:hypothetical protein B7494_g1875 [Chlorociboria aeruginascens]|nr:hypothetical protein B7494_g1875 [Chlorociboria aeruginascens]
MTQQVSQKKQQELQLQYTNYKNGLQQIAQKIGDVEQEAEEHKLVLETLEPLSADRKCFRMINGVLVERTVKDVVPALKTNSEGLRKVLEDLVKQYNAKQTEMEKWKVCQPLALRVERYALHNALDFPRHPIVGGASSFILTIGGDAQIRRWRSLANPFAGGASRSACKSQGLETALLFDVSLSRSPGGRSLLAARPLCPSPADIHRSNHEARVHPPPPQHPQQPKQHQQHAERAPSSPYPVESSPRPIHLPWQPRNFEKLPSDILQVAKYIMSASPPKETDVEQGVQSPDDPDAQMNDPQDPHASALGYEFEVKEQDRWLPIANVARIMKTALPENAKIAKEAKECMQECVSEFISFITSEASEKCHQEKRKTVNGEDILFAMTSLGFENYSEALKIYLSKYREAQSTRGDNQNRPGSQGFGSTTAVGSGANATSSTAFQQGGEAANNILGGQQTEGTEHDRSSYGNMYPGQSGHNGATGGGEGY